MNKAHLALFFFISILSVTALSNDVFIAISDTSKRKMSSVKVSKSATIAQLKEAFALAMDSPKRNPAYIELYVSGRSMANDSTVQYWQVQSASMVQAVKRNTPNFTGLLAYANRGECLESQRQPSRFHDPMYRIDVARTRKLIAELPQWENLLNINDSQEFLNQANEVVNMITMRIMRYTHPIDFLIESIKRLYEKGYKIFAQPELPDPDTLLSNTLWYLDREKPVMHEDEKGRDRNGNQVSVWLLDRKNVLKYLSYFISHELTLALYPADEDKKPADRFFPCDR